MSEIYFGKGRQLKIKKGERYGKLIIVKEIDSHIVNGNQVERVFLCKCDCGGEKNVGLFCLRNGVTKSCGCLIKTRSIKHGLRHTRIYNIWLSIKQRCNNKKTQYYYCYGERGISYDKKWEKFEGFYDDMKDGYNDKLSIDRIDNNGNYCKENCRWATNTEQANNTSKNRFININGETKTIRQWEDKMNFRKGLISGRLHRGWSEKKAVLIKPRLKKLKIS